MNSDLIGEQITKFRKAAGLTQEELGKAVGVSTQAVSRWECGGAPDVSLLPAIADKLDVTIDALFGREGGVREDIGGEVRRWLFSLPEDQQIDSLCRLVWEAAKSTVFRQAEDLVLPDLSYLDKCVTRIQGEEVLVRMTLNSRNGLLFGVGAEDMAFMSVWPNPKAGYAAYFAPRDLCRKLFALLARPGALELLEKLHDDTQPPHYVPEVLARKTGLPPQDTAELLEAMTELRLVDVLELELETGAVKAYRVHENWAFAPLMQFTRCFLERHDAFYMTWDSYDLWGNPDSTAGRLVSAAPPVKKKGEST